MPSLYGPRKEKFSFRESRDVRLMGNETFFENLKEEIKHKMNDHSKQRCVFVCFENKIKLNKFFNCKEYALYRSNTFRLTEEADKDEKSTIVKRATISGKILLLTKSFGRGTDFHVNDKIVKSNGGPHVIQTFLSLQKSEEIQIQGRTARQGGKGSYSMILNKKELMDEFDIKDDELKKAENEDTIYQLLDRKRSIKFEKLYKENERFVVEASKNHNEATTFVDNLINGDCESVRRQLISLNRGPGISTSKIVVLMDATGSMNEVIQQAKNTVSTMFDRVTKILDDNGYDAKCFQLQFIAYRSYDVPSGDMLLQRSGWSSDATELRDFLNGVQACYGILEEAVEVALQYVNQCVKKSKVAGDVKISTVLLIGDAPPTPSMKTVEEWRKCEEYGCGFWDDYPGFEKATYYKDEIAILKETGIKVNCYYVHEWAKESFEWMANETGGECSSLNVDDERSAERLTGIVSKIVLNACDTGESDQLVKEYEKRFSKLMHTT